MSLPFSTIRPIGIEEDFLFRLPFREMGKARRCVFSIGAVASFLFVAQVAFADARFPGGPDVLGAENANNNLFTNDLDSQSQVSSDSNDGSGAALTDSGTLSSQQSLSSGGEMLLGDIVTSPDSGSSIENALFSSAAAPDSSGSSNVVQDFSASGNTNFSDTGFSPVDPTVTPDLVSAVPEPGTLAVTALAIGAIAMRRRRAQPQITFVA
jgi:hypothetical protein